MVNGPSPSKKTHRRCASDTDIKQFQTLKLPVASFNDRKGSLMLEDLPEEASDAKHTWSETLPPTEGCQLPRPRFENQSLVNYIMSGDFCRQQAALDQVNAHILLAETVIQMGADASLDLLQTKPHGSRNSVDYANSDMEQIQSQLRDLNVSSSATSAVLSEEELPEAAAKAKPPIVPPFLNQRSAEATALKMLFAMKDPHTIKASDLQFIATEKDAPQSLLPIPENGPQATELRGDETWAPPRPQLILQLHNKKKK